MSESVFTPEKIAWAKSLIMPDLPEYDEKDHEIAKLRYVINCIWEEIADLWCEVAPIGGGDAITLEQAGKRLSKMCFGENGDSNEPGCIPDGIDMEFIHRYAEENRWSMWKQAHLEDWHCGDCTAFPASCVKCHAERFYGFETPYEGKQAGWEALHIFLKTRETNHDQEQE